MDTGNFDISNCEYKNANNYYFLIQNKKYDMHYDKTSDHIDKKT